MIKYCTDSDLLAKKDYIIDFDLFRYGLSNCQTGNETSYNVKDVTDCYGKKFYVFRQTTAEDAAYKAALPKGLWMMYW